MKISISKTKEELGRKAAKDGAQFIRKAIAKNGKANIIVATGASQFEMLAELVKEDIDWSKVTAFHLDEYIGLPNTHPASFRKYLKEHFVDIVAPREFHYVNGEINPDEECRRLGKIIAEHPIDVAFVALEKTDIWRLMIRQPILKPKKPTWPWILMMIAENNKWGKVGSQR